MRDRLNFLLFASSSPRHDGDPYVQQGELVTMESTIDRIIEKARSLGSVISAAKSQAASVSLPNVGGGARTGRVAQAFANSPSAGEA